jgi:hypothetical protein
MELNLTKIFGWVLIFAGLAIIIWPLYFSYNIFQGESKAPDIFGIEEKTIQEQDISEEKFPDISVPAEFQKEFQEQSEKIISEQFKKLLPAGALPKLLNLIAWSIIAGLFILGGFQISNLGVKMVKK